MRLDGKVVVITGAGAGLGRECALLFAREGGKIAVTDVSAARAEATARAIKDQGGTAIARKVDVTREDEVRDAVQAAVDEFGRLDVMFNNAGIPVPRRVPFEEFTAEEWHRVVDVNLTGVFFGCKHAVPPMRRQGGGSIIMTSSASSFVGYPGFAMYAATKGGVNAFVRGLAVDLGEYGIRVNAICPTHGMSANFLMPQEAEVMGRSYEELQGAWNPDDRRMPLRVSRPPGLLDHANVALFLASDDSVYMSGVCIPTGDGGTLAKVAINY